MVWTTQVLHLGSNIAQMAFITTGPSNYGTEKWFANDVPELVVGGSAKVTWKLLKAANFWLYFWNLAQEI